MMGPREVAMIDSVRKRIRITGVVQGVGFRPFVWRRATRLHLSGWVENDAAGVVVEVQGVAAAVERFLDGLAAAVPPLAHVTALDITNVPHAGAIPGERFTILESAVAAGPRRAVVPPDIAPCGACLAELGDPADRRHGYAFINCTDCGPRFTIIDTLPYDRRRTTMRSFAMCPACEAEYRDPASRRFHAQPNACPICGPAVWFAAHASGPVPVVRGEAACVGETAIAAARAALRAGGIVAVKGVGGFHLACDATNLGAVNLLRARKQRLRKPFAVMVADTAAATTLAHVREQEQRLLERPERPIVLLRPRDGTGVSLGIPDHVAPGNDFLGVMLPSSPLHNLLSAGMPPLVMTSGNRADEPIATGNAEAVGRLAMLADAFLLHDRKIHVACDDSVIRCVAGLPLPLRRSRGHAPLPIRLATGGPPVLAVGGELKATLCLARDHEATMSQHIGDLGSLETLETLERSATHLMSLTGVQPAAVVADLHPGYASTRWAREFAVTRGIPCLQVQHHEAHVASLLAEHGRDAAGSPGVIGVCFDGTGYGSNGTIHGGEFFVSDGPLPRRAAHLMPFPLPGGDVAIRHPWRVALALLRHARLPWNDAIPSVRAASAGDRDILARQLDRQLACTDTTSMGRLFDAVASLTGVRQSIDYEAEAALNLEALAAAENLATTGRPYLLPTHAAVDGPITIDWRPLVRAVVADVEAGESPGSMAARFHAAVAGMIVETCILLRDRGAGATVGLTGGVFQNAWLVERSLDGLHAADFEVLTHHTVPPNDGGLALGQVVLGRALLASAVPSL